MSRRIKNSCLYGILGLSLVIAGGLTGCDQPKKTPEAASWTGNGIEVQKLFTHEGCTIFKFYDEYRYRYYVVCDKAAKLQVIEQNNCGKSCEDVELVQTTVKETE